MSEIVNTATIKVVADGSGVEAGLRPVEDAVKKTGKSLDDLGATAKKTGKAIEDIGSGPGLGQAADGAGAASTKMDRATKSMADSIKRTTAAMEAGSKGTAEYYRALANQRGVDVNALRPFLDQLNAVTQRTTAAAEAQRKLDESTKFLSELKARAEGVGKTASQLAEMRAAQLGVSESAAPMIARMREAERGTSGLAAMVGRAKEALVGLAAGMSIATFVHQVIESQREFDKLNSSLITATGSVDGAKIAFEALQKFAATTPYSVKEATEAFIKMKNLGLDPSERALRSYGNTASAMGKTLDDMIEAVADASTGEFERLKEFGIKAKKNGDQVALTFQGVTKKIGTSAQEIEGYLQKIGEVQFGGGMELRAKTLDGAISNLGDSWDSFLRKVAQSGIGDATRSAVLSLSGAVDTLGNSVDTLASGLAASAKIATAYVGAFVVAPAVFQSAATAVGVLQVQLALARMEMAAGVTMSTLLSTSLGGMSISAHLAAGALGALKVAGGVLFALFAGWEIGKWLSDNFVQARLAGLTFVGVMLTGWESVKYAAQMAWEGIGFAWDKTVGAMKESFAGFLEKTAGGLAFVGAKDTAKQIEAYASGLRAAAGVQSTFADRTAGLTAAHKAAVDEIDKNIVELMQYELAADGAGKSTGTLAQFKLKAAAASKELSEEAKKELEAYKGLVESVKEKIAASSAEAAGRAALTESQKLQVALDEQLASGKLKLTAAHKAEYEALIKRLGVNEEVIASNKRAKAAGEDFAKMMKEWNDASDKKIEDAVKEADANERLAETFGMTKKAIAELEVARLEEQLAQHGAGAFYLDEIEKLEKLIDAKRRAAAALGNLEAKEENKKAFDQMVEDAKRSSEQISQSLTDNIMRGGKSAADYLRDLFRTLILRPIISPIGNSIGAAITSSMPSIAASTGVAGSGLIGAASAASSLYGAATGGLLNIGGSAIAGLGNLVGSSSLSGFGAGFAANAAGTTMTAAEVFAGAGMAAEASAATFGAAVSAALPWVAGAVAAASLWSSAFGHGETEVQGQGIRGTISASSLTGKSYQELHQDGGWFSSDRDWEEKTDFTDAMVKQFTQGLSSLETAAAGFASSLGVQADWIASYSKDFDLKLTGDQTKDQQIIADFFSSIGDEIAQKLVPNLDDLSKSGETASAALERLANDFKGTDQIAQLLGFSASSLFGSAGLDSAKAREQLIDMAGGLQVLSEYASTFNQNFLTDAERIKPVAEALDKALASLGLNTIPTTRDEFKSLVNSLITSGAAATESGAKQLDSLLALAEAFAQVHPAADAAAEAVDKAAEALQAMKDSASSLLGGVDSAYSVLEKVVGREKAAIQTTVDAHSEAVSRLQSLSQALHSTLDSMLSPEQKLFQRARAQAEIRADLAITKAGGTLSDAQTESLKKALSAVTQDASSQFSSYSDYLRDLAQTQNDIGALAGLTDDSLSVEQKALAAAQDQLKSLDAILTNAQSQIDELKGQSTTLLSINDALGGLTTAIQAAQANPIVSATSGINQAYQQMLGRAPDAAGLEYWQQVAAGGTSINAIKDSIGNSAEAQVRKLYQDLLGRPADAGGLDYYLHTGASISAIADSIKQSDEYKSKHPIPGFASGGMFGGGLRIVGENGPELEATGPSRIWSSNQTAALLARAGSGDNAALVAEIKALRDEVKQLREANSAENRAIAKGAQQTAEHLDAAINGDTPLATKVIPA